MKTRLLFLPLLLLAAACVKLEDPIDTRGNEDQVIEYISQEVYDELKNLGFTMHFGPTPPDITGVYYIEPVLYNTNLENDQIGRAYAASNFELHSFDPEELEIYCSFGTEQSHVGAYSLITGSGNNFSVYQKLDISYDNGYSSQQVRVYSGKWNEDGSLTNYSSSLYMVYADEELNLIPIGAARIFKDKKEMPSEGNPGERILALPSMDWK